MLDYILKKTDEYLQSMDKTQRKKIGQFFTSKATAEFMASMIINKKENLEILDLGAGSGILSAALIDKLQNTCVKTINLTLYENVLPLLHNNIEYISQNSRITVNYKIIEKNYILENKEDFNATLLSKENVLQETIIISVIKTKENYDSIKISSTESNSDFKYISEFIIKKFNIIESKNVAGILLCP